MAKLGKVYLIGAGPGDPGLITLKGASCLAKAEVIIYDRLVNPKLLLLNQKNAETVYVGKRTAAHTVAQEEINELLAEKALAGKTVARLKGGDAFIFGRGGEEALYLAERHIPFEVIPGVTSAYAVPAYAGIPVTHRGLASDVAFVTGHEYREEGSLINWEKLAQGVGTLVFLMGVKQLPLIATNLIKHGRAADSPVAVITWGTTSKQNCVVGSLADIVAKTEAVKLKPPAVIVVGEVVKLRDKLKWFELKPLFGKKVLITRAKNQASELADMLTEAGAEVLELPTIEIKPLAEEEYAVLDKAVKNLAQQNGYYHWVIFTSVNTVYYWQQRLNQLGFDWRLLNGTAVAAVGEATKAALKKQGILVELMPANFRAEGLIAEFKRLGVKNKRLLLPRALEGREILPKELENLGAEVTVAPAYKTVFPSEAPAYITDQILAGEISVTVFTSGSTIKGLAKLLKDKGELQQLLASSQVAVIGPVTAKAAAKFGLNVSISPKKATTQDLAAAIINHFLLKA